MSGQIAVYIVTAIILVAGVALAWFWQIAPSARERRDEARLEHIGAPWYYFAAMAFFTVICGVLAQALFGLLCKWLWPEIQMSTVFGKMISVGAFGAGVTGGALQARRLLAAMQTLQNAALSKLPSDASMPTVTPLPPIALSKILPVGLGVFCITRMAAGLVALVWNRALDYFGVPPGEQDIVQVFRGESSPARLLAMILVAIVIAPVWEEIIFRGALFGYLRTRLPRLLAFVLPALIFAAVHYEGHLSGWRVLMPLFVMGLIHCKAYERTGRIGVIIISHALFNLTTIALVFSGVEI